MGTAIRLRALGVFEGGEFREIDLIRTTSMAASSVNGMRIMRGMTRHAMRTVSNPSLAPQATRRRGVRAYAEIPVNNVCRMVQVSRNDGKRPIGRTISRAHGAPQEVGSLM